MSNRYLTYQGVVGGGEPCGEYGNGCVVEFEVPVPGETGETASEMFCIIGGEL